MFAFNTLYPIHLGFGNASVIYELPYYNGGYALPPRVTLYHFLAVGVCGHRPQRTGWSLPHLTKH